MDVLFGYSVGWVVTMAVFLVNEAWQRWRSGVVGSSVREMLTAAMLWPLTWAYAGWLWANGDF